MEKKIEKPGVERDFTRPTDSWGLPETEPQTKEHPGAGPRHHTHATDMKSSSNWSRGLP